MKSYDFEAVTWESDVYCIPCLPDTAKEADTHLIFADSEWDSAPVCCVCSEVHDYICLIVADPSPLPGGPTI